ncbi:hypothetical protein TwortDSMZ_195 [Staphylococcus phage Twort]|uniref:Uncharacterized protein n=1 Tax=Staphylococcus phage Twort (strain DSM 17442 / HER 48) TaxID=2908167 RepID=A0A6H0X5U0_BPTWO|nr:hypothetical protein TwortDSMZ_006 [Staphylococcus phage Twort]QIW89222.1 hypothetical protein TwortDSMZ_195 [Staphylococcus phage Twort]
MYLGIFILKSTIVCYTLSIEHIEGIKRIQNL